MTTDTADHRTEARRWAWKGRGFRILGATNQRLPFPLTLSPPGRVLRRRSFTVGSALSPLTGMQGLVPLGTRPHQEPSRAAHGTRDCRAPAIQDMTRVSGARCQEPGQRPICTNSVISRSLPSLSHGHCHAGAGDWGLCRLRPPGAHPAAYPGLGLSCFPFVADNQQHVVTSREHPVGKRVSAVL